MSREIGLKPASPLFGWRHGPIRRRRSRALWRLFEQGLEIATHEFVVSRQDRFAEVDSHVFPHGRRQMSPDLADEGPLARQRDFGLNRPGLSRTALSAGG